MNQIQKDETANNYVPESETILSVQGLECIYHNASGEPLRAINKISFDVYKGETLGLVGESGCGKSTTGKCLVQLEKASAGRVIFQGMDLLTGDKKSSHNQKRPESKQQLQMVFQDPISSLNPRRQCGEIVAEPLRISKKFDEKIIREKVTQALGLVGFDPVSVWDRKPHQFSGGQCQRISLARAIVSEPKFLICDEPVSALDVSVQAQILNLLEKMKVRYGLTMIFISHDLAVIKQICDRVAVMYLGSLCEIAPIEQLYSQPKHPYSQALLQCVPDIDNPLAYDENDFILGGEVPSPLNPPSGCRFRTRCPKAKALCAQQEPSMQELETDQFVACHFPD
ncbi:dipeptide ABC transporter ATP-binding protein [Aurantivibrio infirmus]